MQKTVTEVVSKMNPFLTRLFELFNFKYEIEEAPFKVAMKRYFNKQDFNRLLDFITDVSATKEGDDIQLNIVTHKPSMLIGRNGNFVSGLREHIRNELNLKIKINILESNMWKGLS